MTLLTTLKRRVPRKQLKTALVGCAAVAITLIVSQDTHVLTPQGANAATSFLDTFDGTPTHADSYRPPGWDVTTVRHPDDTIDGMYAEHGPNCEAPDNLWTPNTAPTAGHNHWITTGFQASFQCAGHVMTSMNAGYGAVYLTPPVLMDWSAGQTAVLEWDMSTQRTSARDWVDMSFIPWQAGQENPMALNGVDPHFPAESLMMELVGGGNVFMPHRFTKNIPAGCAPGSYWRPGGVYDCRMNFDGYHTWDMILAQNGLQTSAQRRDHFKIEISQTHVRMGFRPTAGGAYFYWSDTDIPGGVPFTQALVQLSQRAYNPLKPCGFGVGEPGWSDQGWQDDCRANTWHWDNVSISPAVPITIVPGPRRVNGSATVTFPQPAAANSFIRTAGDWDATYSVNGGSTWLTMPEVGARIGAENGISYWAPVPVGVQTVMFRGQLQDVYLYSRTVAAPPAGTPTPTVLPTNTAVPTSTPTPGPSSTPTATATSVPAPATPGAAQDVTLNFDSLPHPAIGQFSGQYPAGVINWGTNQWYYSGPYAQFPTNSISFNGAGSVSKPFSFVTPKTMLSIDADNGSGTATTVTAACAGQPTVSLSVPANSVRTLLTNWTTACTTVTLSAANGWDTNFDNLIYR
jgi:hypothetical protein